MARAKAERAEREQAIEQLREWIKPGDTVYTILDHVSTSGMSRAIRVLVPIVDGIEVESTPPGGRPTDYVRKDSVQVEFRHPNYAVGKALGLRHWKRNGREQDALVVGGCGMDMGFHLVYELSHTLYAKGYQCLGKGKCPSNYHSNHHDTIRCEGGVRSDGEHVHCYAPHVFGRYEPDPNHPRGGSTLVTGKRSTVGTSRS